jgi:orotate phosphoribosyltransferase-like protein
VIFPENVYAIHAMNMDDRNMAAKKIGETLDISRERVGYIICKMSRSVTEFLLHKPFWTDFGGILVDFLIIL